MAPCSFDKALAKARCSIGKVHTPCFSLASRPLPPSSRKTRCNTLQVRHSHFHRPFSHPFFAPFSYSSRSYQPPNTLSKAIFSTANARTRVQPGAMGAQNVFLLLSLAQKQQRASCRQSPATSVLLRPKGRQTTRFPGAKSPTPRREWCIALGASLLQQDR